MFIGAGLNIPPKFYSLETNYLLTNVKIKYMINFDPLGQPTVTAGRDHCFRTLFKSSKTKQSSLLARLWVWPSGSLMTPVLLVFTFNKPYNST